MMLLSFAVQGQKEFNIWYFGDNAGIDFNSGVAAPLTNGSLNTIEGCASVCDTAGNILFYTNGVTVYNRQHAIMSNGTGLFGDQSTIQSALIVPDQKDDNIYFIFTMDDGFGPNGLNYSIVDMAQQAGLGAVTSKNNYLGGPYYESLTAVRHATSRGVWVVAVTQNNLFHSYLVDTTGVISAPVASQLNISVLGGQLQSSPNSKFLGNAKYLFSFDNTTGAVSTFLFLQQSGLSSEFSPDGSRFYAADPFTGIYQFDLNAGSPAAIWNSRTLVYDTGGGFLNVGSMQRAPDGKIYIARPQVDSLMIIKNPNILGLSCSPVYNGFYLGGKTSQYGLNNIYLKRFRDAEIDFTGHCFGDSTAFVIQNLGVADSVNWEFGDTATTRDNHSSLYEPKHLYSSVDSFVVSLYIFNNGSIDTFTKGIRIFTKPQPNLGNDTAICQGDSLILRDTASSQFRVWNTQDTTVSITVSLPGVYWLELSNMNCANRDSIVVSYLSPPGYHYFERYKCLYRRPGVTKGFW